MPEGHVIHRLAASYTEAFAGRATRSSSPQGRFADSAALIDGRPLDAAEAYGKHLFCHFGPDIVHIHLGMAGKTSLHHAPQDTDALLAERPVTGAVRWRLENDDAWCDLRGPAICRLVDDDARRVVLARLGPDPLRQDAEPDQAWARVHRSKRSIAELLMDQKIFAGVGNIFRAEVLYRAGMDPMLPGVGLSRADFDLIWDDLVELMAYAVRHGRIDTVRDEHSPETTGRAPRQDRHGGEVYVYRRAALPCHVCDTPVRTVVVAQRNLFWCPGCQPEPAGASA
ncbi:endonuclease-8/formamidopyrimidine-DNA glycosylase [Austwickia chelonae]|uniref:DNA-(apurinic or apyrimidinic site) lyase n=1 Tax=Austwickia chelonae NBRC 105200 TaxID=1184607 RepID=K6V877_9MICO|nr:DNA-formamidopyrimidine glycosylase family protein [Austwickia chelonae]GAB78428.1 putative DNA glycosylase [Austwickia chelonae NBRC 105200]SEW39430.1 endonuclease-8/formamidopyrimidine-DNA glycosylase [Austwickia chelonae]